VLGCALELLGALELLDELESAGAALAPPEAEPDFVVSADEELEELGGVTPMDVLDDEAPGAVEGDDGVALSLRAVLELEPGADEVRAASSRLHAARPKASATASARVVSFMSPPWLGIRELRRQ
jgi:hypothetical protein